MIAVNPLVLVFFQKNVLLCENSGLLPEYYFIC